MRKKFPRTSVIALTAAFALTLVVGSQRGSAASYLFQPPSGWRQTMYLGNGLGAWAHPGDRGFNQNVNVLAERFAGSLSQYTKVSVSQIQAKLPNVKFGAVQRATVCGSHPATYLTYAATVFGRPLVYEQMVTIWQGVAYVATYTRMVTQPSLHDARSSLTTLCGMRSMHRPTTHYAAPVSYPSPTATPYLAPTVTPQTYGSAVPTVTPRVGP